MPSYENSKIYKIEPIVPHEPNEIYIGSTTVESLCRRLAKHRNSYENFKQGMSCVTVYRLFEKYGAENCEIELLENVNARNRDELNCREGYYIRNTQNINKLIAGRTPEEFRRDNVEYERERSKRYRLENATKEQERKRIYICK